MSRRQWDEWESLRIIQVVQNALIQLGAGQATAAPGPSQGLPAATPQPLSATLGPRQLLAQAWRVVDMKIWKFPPPSCTTQDNCWTLLRIVPLAFCPPYPPGLAGHLMTT